MAEFSDPVGEPRGDSQWGRRLRLVGIVIVVVLAVEVVSALAIDTTNPDVVNEPNWDSPRTRELAAAACFDCHSNETEWPWYSYIAPGSWLMWNDVREGRSTLNFSEWTGRGELGEIAEVIQEGEMPPWYYSIMHPSADLSSSEQQELVDGLRATVAQSR